MEVSTLFIDKCRKVHAFLNDICIGDIGRFGANDAFVGLPDFILTAIVQPAIGIQILRDTRHSEITATEKEKKRGLGKLCYEGEDESIEV